MFNLLSNIQTTIALSLISVSLLIGSGYYISKLYKQRKYEKKIPIKEVTFNECIQSAITQADFDKCSKLKKGDR